MDTVQGFGGALPDARARICRRGPGQRLDGRVAPGPSEPDGGCRSNSGVRIRRESEAQRLNRCLAPRLSQPCRRCLANECIRVVDDGRGQGGKVVVPITASPPADEDVRRVVARVRRRLERLGVTGAARADEDVDPLADESPALAGLSRAAILGRAALGPRAGRRPMRIGVDPDALYHGRS